MEGLLIRPHFWITAFTTSYSRGEKQRLFIALTSYAVIALARCCTSKSNSGSGSN